MRLRNRRDEGKKKKMENGFTLLELVIVIIVIVILAGLAAPQYFRIVEKARTAEGVQLLGIVRGAQLRYYAQYASYANNVSQLDINYTTPKYFAVSAGDSEARLATVMRNNNQNPGYGAYNLSINVAGDINCTGGVTGVCDRLGLK